MSKRSPEVDAYIAKAAPFAQPILAKIRDAFHAAGDVDEVMKWSFPHFEYKGILGNMAAFKSHVSWGFWKAKLMADPKGILTPINDRTTMNAAKVSSEKDLPSKKVMVEYVREAMRLNDEGVKVARPKSTRSDTPLEVPDDLAAALKRDRKARTTFDAFSPSQRREYVEWLSDAKQEATRQKRLATTLEWLAEGKARHWKYQK